MIRGRQAIALRQVQVLFDLGTMGGLSDRQLLDRFASRADDAAEPAFAALIERHGPMVLRTCRSILRDEHAVEDAFQATFLVLVRRAGSLWVRDSLGPWLLQVAVRVASSARSAEARRHRHENRKAEQTDTLVHDRVGDDVRPVIHEELSRLPERFRAPLVLCCMEGLTQQQAAGHLGWPLGTLQSRLARGRERLRGRLLRRGLTPSAALVATLLSAEGLEAAISPILLASTIRAAMQFAAGKAAVTGVLTARVATLTQGVLRTMLMQKLRVVLAAIVAAAMTAAGAGVWAQQSLRADSEAPIESPAPLFAEPEGSPSEEVEPGLFLDGDEEEFDENEKTDPARPETAISPMFGDGKPDGKKSLGGTGEMIELAMPDGTSKVVGVKIHGSRYGQPQAPKESFLIYFLTKDRKRILHTEMAPYSLFKRGAEEWVEIKFESPVTGLPKLFWVVVDFRAHQTKGVYVSFDTTTGGKFSRIGLPGMPSSEVTFGGDWMIQATFAE
jgi:RNA polymerase sigma factor (sigma-70 family)